MSVDLAHIRQVMAEADCLFNNDEVEAAIGRVAEAINRDLGETNPVVFCVMNGGLIFSGKLLPLLDFPLELSYLHATRYRNETSGGELFWKAKPEISFIDRDVLIIDDILDEGHTLSAIIDFCKHAGARAVHTAVLVDKEHERRPGPTSRPASPASTAPTATCSATAWTTRATGATPRASSRSRGSEMAGPRYLDQQLFAELASGAGNAPRGRQHHNFHRMEEPCHRMAVGLQPNTYIPPHRHLDAGKAEALIVLKGRLGLLVFAEDGELLDKRELSAAGDCPGVDLPPGVFHALVVLEPDSILFECKAGPYRPLGEGEFASWAPAEGSADAPAYRDWMRAQFA